MRLGRPWVQLERAATRLVCPPEVLVGRIVVHVDPGVAVGDSSERLCVPGIDLHRLLIHPERALETVAPHPMRELPSPEVILVRSHVGPLARASLPLPTGALQLERADD